MATTATLMFAFESSFLLVHLPWLYFEVFISGQCLGTAFVPALLLAKLASCFPRCRSRSIERTPVSLSLSWLLFACRFTVILFNSFKADLFRQTWTAQLRMQLLFYSARLLLSAFCWRSYFSSGCWLAFKCKEGSCRACFTVPSWPQR